MAWSSKGDRRIPEIRWQNYARLICCCQTSPNTHCSPMISWNQLCNVASNLRMSEKFTVILESRGLVSAFSMFAIVCNWKNAQTCSNHLKPEKLQCAGMLMKCCEYFAKKIKATWSWGHGYTCLKAKGCQGWPEIGQYWPGTACSSL